MTGDRSPGSVGLTERSSGRSIFWRTLCLGHSGLPDRLPSDWMDCRLLYAAKFQSGDIFVHSTCVSRINLCRSCNGTATGCDGQTGCSAAADQRRISGSYLECVDGALYFFPNA